MRMHPRDRETGLAKIPVDARLETALFETVFQQNLLQVEVPRPAGVARPINGTIGSDDLPWLASGRCICSWET